MNTTTIRHRWATVAAVAGIAVGFPSVAIAGPQPIAHPTATVRTDERPSSTVDEAFRPCFIIQSHWNPAYDGFVPVCDRPREQSATGQSAAAQANCPPAIDPRSVGVPWVSSVRTGCDSRDRWWIQIARR